jgi:tRNA A-37 threonylcarbamoyl transferase component Bud32
MTSSDRVQSTQEQAKKGIRPDMKNPFTAGKWVRGEQFIGRQDLLEKVLHGSRNYVWVTGTRRLGKTSLLKQLEHLSQSPPGVKEYIVLLWDLQGSRNLAGLKDSLLESVEAAEERFERIGIGAHEISGLSIFEILRHLERKARDKDLSLMLLCDECEELLNIEKAAPETLPRLRRVLQQGESLRTVLTATRRLSLLERSALSDTSPFLNGFVPPLYLSRLSDDEARTLIKPGGFRPEDIQVVMDKTNNHPYLVQLLCERLFDGGILDEVIEDATADDVVSHFFSVDYESLDPAEKKILLLLVQGQHLDAVALEARIGVAGDRVNALLYELKQLGCIKQVGAGYSISNYFFERWLRREVDGLSKALAFDPATSSNNSSGATLELRGIPEPGETLGHHEILGKIGSGGMGVVFKARDVKLKRVVALKVLLPNILSAEERYVERFMREAQAASSLNHPGITTVYEVGEDRGRHYISMEYVQGRTLKVWRHDDPKNFVAQLGAAIQAGWALAAAHAHSVVHRDIKPENIMITEEGVVKIMDFGLAQLRLEGEEKLTRTGIALGTPAYMSPEQALGGTIDHRTDVFSFGIVLYELFSGQRPFEGENHMAVLYAIVNKEPRPLRDVNRDLPEAIEAIVMRSLKKDKAERYQEMQDLATDLEQASPAAHTKGRWSRWRIKR